MKFRQFAFNNVIRNKRLYLGHFLSSTFAVMIFFTFQLLASHPNFSGDLPSASVTMTVLATQGFKIAQYLIMFFSFFFILYSVNGFLKTRKRELGILLIHGMTNWQLKKLIFIENMLIGSSAIVGGIVCGLIFGRLILIMSATLLSLGQLQFYFPTKALLFTCLSFFLLFIVISIFTTRTMKVSQLIELMDSEEKPKPEPKSSKWLALLSVFFILIGYAAAFSINSLLGHGDSYAYAILICVFFSVLGTYFLYTQLSFYLIKYIKKRERTFLKKTNILTISELAYRMTDNARTLFLVTILSAVTFTSVGVCLSLGNRALAEAHYPYAFSYTSYKGNTDEEMHVSNIKQKLKDAGFSYKLVPSTVLRTENYMDIMSLTDYNTSAKILGHPVEVLQTDEESVVLPSKSPSLEELNKNLPYLTLKEGELSFHISGKKIVKDSKLRPSRDFTIVVTDSVYKQIKNKVLSQEDRRDPYTQYRFFVEDWTKTEEVANKLMDILSYDDSNTSYNDDDSNKFYKFESLILKWLEGKQVNGVLSMISVLVGIVFFVFAISFLYFRLFTDLDRDKSQYQMLSKTGLTQKELKKIVTRQISILFFVPIFIAIIHSSVAFTAVQYLAEKQEMYLSTAQHSIYIFTGFIVVQVIYFLLIRRSYLRQLLRPMR
ncbi:FtsX-like permease family protein [Bacillus paramycoides]|uniref:FtsX-like permease family protein n=1 Tax=Bacillus paramycoides TaxID=2026194 RepID=UPI0015C11E75|nr:ABC transporter permease [Bacillus paramycoides]NWK71699.1 FtsX-like permease family protein [Bacillus paramycoides]